jgi:hypothetical protein
MIRILTVPGRGHSVSASAALATLQALITLLEATDEELNDERSIEVDIDAIKQGSLELYLSTLAVSAVALSAIFGCLKAYFEFRKAVVESRERPTIAEDGTSPPSEKADQSNKSTVPIAFGVEVANIDRSIVNIYNDPRVIGELDRAGRELRRDGRIKGVQNLHDDGIIAHFDEEELESLRAQEAPSLTHVPDPTTLRQVYVIVQQPALDNGGKWRFQYEGRSIMADIKDDAFISRMLNRTETFATGDRLVVDLRLLFKRDRRNRRGYREVYSIVRVHGRK